MRPERIAGLVSRSIATGHLFGRQTIALRMFSVLILLLVDSYSSLIRGRLQTLSLQSGHLPLLRLPVQGHSCIEGNGFDFKGTGCFLPALVWPSKRWAGSDLHVLLCQSAGWCELCVLPGLGTCPWASGDHADDPNHPSIGQGLPRTKADSLHIRLDVAHVGAGPRVFTSSREGEEAHSSLHRAFGDCTFRRLQFREYRK